MSPWASSPPPRSPPERRDRRRPGPRRLGFWLALVAADVALWLWQAPSPAVVQRHAVRVAGEVPALPALHSVPTLAAHDEPKARGSLYSGTAFVLPPEMTWATARHVVEGCREVEIEAGGWRLEVAEVVLPPRGDAAVAVAGGPTLPGFELEPAGSAAARSGPVFALGFPQGQRGAVVARFLAEVVVTGPPYGAALGAAWSVDRFPLLPDPSRLGGISGGPVIAADGRVLGITVASNPRRAMIATVDPRHATSPADTVSRTLRPRRAVTPPIAPAEVDRLNERLQAEGAIGRVLCHS